MARTPILGMCALCPWRYDLGLRSDTPLGHGQQLCEIYGSEELWPGHGFRACVHCDLGLGDMTLGQGHNIPLGDGQELCEIYPDPTWQRGVMAWSRILGMYAP